LLPDSKADRVVRPPEKANLMEHGFVLSEVMIDKNWSDKEVFQYLDQCFQEKLSSESFSSGGWRNNHFNTLGICFVYKLQRKGYNTFT
jgi:hypothetical protein